MTNKEIQEVLEIQNSTNEHIETICYELITKVAALESIVQQLKWDLEVAEDNIDDLKSAMTIEEV